MISTPVADEFIKDFEIKLFAFSVIVFSEIEGSDLSNTIFIDVVERSNTGANPDLSNSQKLYLLLRLIGLSVHDYPKRAKDVVIEAESLMQPNIENIRTWLQIYRVKFEMVHVLLKTLEEQEINDYRLYKLIIQDMSNGDFFDINLDFCLSTIKEISRPLWEAWLIIKNYFLKCKKFINKTEDYEIALIDKTDDWFSKYHPILIPQYIKSAQETELKNILQVYQTHKKIEWRGSIYALVSTIDEWLDKGIIRLPTGQTTKEYILKNFTTKTGEINPRTLGNDISRFANNR